MAIELNQFAPNTPIAGLYVYMANLPQLHNVIVSSTQTTALNAGDIVTLDTASTNTDAAVVKKAAVTNPVFGVVVYNPVVNEFNAGDRISIARPNDIVWLPAADAITVGSILYFNANSQVTSTKAEGATTIGKAITSAASAGDFVQVELGF